jgi:hypothetical protein
VAQTAIWARELTPSLAVMTGDARVRADTLGTIARSHLRLTGDRSPDRHEVAAVLAKLAVGDGT